MTTHVNENNNFAYLAIALILLMFALALSDARRAGSDPARGRDRPPCHDHLVGHTQELAARCGEWEIDRRRPLLRDLRRPDGIGLVRRHVSGRGVSAPL
ncbi:hypothetical protein [Thiocapsa bogorovii]|uniref:hypothetical protein n=1 Tax=Thiocapsa bogorovii TaxID=521689 RepID=UPI001E42C2EC|nr:hypothetical protein [Thiocapsa bogorovii]UHD15241.1 hypothetical protein LT988_18490 [Thiocapsa bogorovii]